MNPRRPIHVLSAIFVAMLFASLAPNAFGYTATLNAGVSENEVKLGQRFTYTLVVTEEGDAGRKQSTIMAPEFGPFSIEGSGRTARTSVANGQARRETNLTFTLSSDTPGKHRIDPATLRLTDTATGVVQDMTSNEVVVTVLDEKPGVMDEIRDIKEPKTFFDHVRRVFYLIVGMVALALVVAVAVIYMAARRYRHKPTVAKPMPKMDPREAALAALGLASRLTADPREFYTAVTDALRRYLKDAHGIHAVEATTTELVDMAEASGMQKEPVGELRGLFEEADLVKFAKYVPTVEDMNAHLERARGFVRRV